MGDPNPRNARAIPIRLPPGVRFYPTGQQLLCYYLTKKNSRDELHDSDLSIPSSSADFKSIGMNMIQEIDLYNYDPCDLPDIACFPYGRGGSKKHWYCFNVKSSSERVKQKARGGFWKRRGPVRDVVDGNEGAVLGKRKTFVFYRGNSSGIMKTDWVMYEYALVDNHRDSFSLCRVFLKSCPGAKIADHVPNSCTEKNVDVPCKQHYGTSTSGIGELLMNADTSVGTENEIQRLPMNSISEQYDSVIAEQTFHDVSQFPMTISWQNQLVDSSNGTVSGSTSFLLEGDFLELNDLILPLPDMDPVG